jgi:hypothetical protein
MHKRGKSIVKAALKRASGGRIASATGSRGPAPKANKLVGEFRDPTERAGGLPWLVPYGMHPHNVDRSLGARRRRDPNEDYPDVGRAVVQRADGGSVIDDLRESIEMRAAHQPDPGERTANLRTTANDVASVLPVIGNAMSARDAVETGGETIAAAGSGNLKRALAMAGLTGLNTVGAVTGLPWGRGATQAAREGSSTANVFIPAAPGKASDKAVDMREDGQPMDRIWRETQRLIAPDGSIRRELRDQGMKLARPLGVGETVPLGQAIEHPALFANMPALADRTVTATDSIDRMGNPVVRTTPEGNFQLNPAVGDIRPAMSKLVQYEINRASGLAHPLRHGAREFEAHIDRARSMADDLDPRDMADRRRVDEYLNSIGDVRDQYDLMRELDSYSGRAGHSPAAAKVISRNAGNIDAKAAADRVTMKPDEMSAWPYRRRPPGVSNNVLPRFEDIYSLPPEGLNQAEMMDFIRRWRELGSGRGGRFANGGRTKSTEQAIKRARVTVGAVNGATGGRDDALKVSVPAGAYVVPADVVAALGGGNSAAGLAKLDKQFKGASAPKYAAGGAVPILISDGEYVITPEAAAALGGGDLDYGHEVLDAFVLNTRQDYAEHLKSLPGPNT